MHRLNLVIFPDLSGQYIPAQMVRSSYRLAVNKRPSVEISAWQARFIACYQPALLIFVPTALMRGLPTSQSVI